jgi:hypothetical protein
MSYKITDTIIVDNNKNISSIGTALFSGPVIIGGGTSTGTVSQPLQVTGTNGAYIGGNLGIGSANPTSKLWVSGDIYGAGIVTAYVLNASKDPGSGIGTDFTNSLFGNGWRVSAPGSTTYYKLATLPAGGGGSTFDHLIINGVLGAWTNGNQTPFEITFSNRGAFNYKYISYGSVRSDVRIIGISTNSNVEIWAQHQVSQFTKLVYTIVNSIQAIVVSNPTSTTTAPTGTTVFDSSTATPRFIINESNNVGVGTTNPTSKLQIVGDALVSGIVTANSFRGDGSLLTGINLSSIGGISSISISSNTTNQSQYLTYATGTGNTTGLGVSLTGLVFNPSSGNLGIGTTAPLQKLHVLGNLLVAAGSSTGQHITQKAYELNSGTLSWEGSAGQLFSITNNLTSGSIFSVNDVSGIPSIDVDASGTISLGAFGGNIGIGTTNATSKLDVVGNIKVVGIVTATTFSGTLSGYASSAGISTNLSGGLAGNIVYQSAANATAFLANGGSGTVLQSNGVGNAPTWVTAAPSGAVSGITVRDSNSNIVGTSGSITQLTFSTGLSVTGTSGAAGIATITLSSNIVGSALSISGISTFTNGPVFIGAATSTGTASQLLQVTGGAYVSGSVGIGTTTPTSKLHVIGDVRVSGVVTATTFVGALTGTATSTTNIPNLTGAITSVNTTTSLGSFSSANLATALTDETGSGSAVFATSPTLVTPVLGAATATSIVVGSGVTINASGINAAAGIITASQLSTGASGTGINITTNTISGPATLTIDPAAVGDNTGAVRIKGDLYVDGTQFVVNSTTIELADFNVGIATTVGTDALLDGAGIGIGSTSIRKTLTWNDASDSLKSSENFDVSSGKTYKVNGTEVLSSTQLTVANINVSGVSTVGFLTATNIWNAGITTSSRLTLNGANDTATGGGQIYLNGATGNRIDFNANGSAAPAFTTRSVGTKIVLFPAIGGSSADHAIGVEGSTNWYGVPTTAQQHRWYAGTTQLADLKGTGEFLLGTTSLTGTASQKLQVDGGAYVSGSVGIGTTNPGATLNVVPTATSIAGLFSGTTSSDMVRITQLGTGNALVVEDSANPDSSPFVVSADGSVGIGTTNPSDKLHVLGGNIRVDSATGAVNFWSGAGFYGSIGAASGFGPTNSDIVIRADAARSIVFQTGGANDRGRIDSNGIFLVGTATSTGTASQKLQVDGGAYVSGSVGIGTTNPVSKLHIYNGNLTIENTAVGGPLEGAYIDFRETGFNDRFGLFADFGGGGDDNKLHLTASSSGAVPQTSDAKVTLLPSGNIGINTTNPGATLNVVPTATSIAGLFSGTTSSDMVRITQLGTGNALVVEDSTNPDSSPFVVTGIGSVGIGTASPAFTADIAGDARVTSTNKMRFGGTAGTTNFYIQYNSTANSLDFVAG